MKKSLVAVGVIVALGVVWTGASWYMGSKIESRLQEETKRTNVQLAQLAKESQLGAVRILNLKFVTIRKASLLLLLILRL